MPLLQSDEGTCVSSGVAEVSLHSCPGCTWWATNAPTETTVGHDKAMGAWGQLSMGCTRHTVHSAQSAKLLWALVWCRVQGVTGLHDTRHNAGHGSRQHLRVTPKVSRHAAQQASASNLR